MKLKLLPCVFLLSMFLISCEEIETPIDSGNADFSQYLSVGNSLTAGYADGGLYREAQLQSYPAILAGQLGVNFTQPLMPEGNGSGYFYMTNYSNGIPSFNFLSPDPNAFNKVVGNFQNLGIPGIGVVDINNPTYGMKNNKPYFYRILESGTESNTTYLDVIQSKSHTFFTCWLGNNDILGYALDGGSAEGSKLTDVAVFEQNYQLLMNALTANDAKGVLLTIPDISIIPYFNLVSNHNFPNLDEDWLADLTGIYEKYNVAVASYNEEIENNAALSEQEKKALKRPFIKFSLEGPNAFVVIDNTLPGGPLKDNEGIELPNMRHLVNGEKITLDGAFEMIDPSKLSGTFSPLKDEFVLTLEELNNIQEHKVAFNNIIKSYQKTDQIAVINADEFLSEFVSGKVIDGEEISTTYIEGGLFSLDGVHLTPRGYSIVANSIIETINQSFSANVPKVNTTNFRKVLIPN